MDYLCWLVRADPDILAGCSLIDRFQIIAKAVLLLAVAGIALFAWGAFLMLGSFLDIKLGSRPVEYQIVARGYGGAERSVVLRAVPQPFALLAD
jgi:hypothetical protein